MTTGLFDTLEEVAGLLDELDDRAAETRDRFYLWVYELPALFVLLVAGGWAAFRRVGG